MKKFSEHVYLEERKRYTISANGFDICEERFRPSEIKAGDTIYILLSVYEIEKIENNKIYAKKK